MSIQTTEREHGRKSTVQRWNKMLSKLATVVGILALAVTVGFGTAAQSDTARPLAGQQVLANGTGPGNAGF